MHEENGCQYFFLEYNGTRIAVMNNSSKLMFGEVFSKEWLKCKGFGYRINNVRKFVY